ncbi:MAG: choice-of-anchor Q domain-containing protein [Thermoguttaceae bacterium]
MRFNFLSNGNSISNNSLNSTKQKQTPQGKATRRLTQRNRHLGMEPLENRELLAVTALEFSLLREAYPELEITANAADYNVIEITAAELSAINLRTAINIAEATSQNDLIVVRTDTAGVVDLDVTPLVFDINSSLFGGVTIVVLGSSRLKLQPSSEHGVINVLQGDISVGGVALTGISNANGVSLSVFDLLQVEHNSNVKTSQLVKISEDNFGVGNYVLDEEMSKNLRVEIEDDVIPPGSYINSTVNVKSYSVTFPYGGTLEAYLTGLSHEEQQAIIAGTFQMDTLHPYDAEKNGNNDLDHCWAGTAANMISYAGWGNINGFQNEDDIFDYFRENFNDGAGNPYYAAEWYMSGLYTPESWSGWAHLKPGATGGNLFPDITASQQLRYNNIYSSSNITSAIDALKRGAGVGLTIGWYEGSAAERYNGWGHIITLWGGVYDTAKSPTSDGYFVSLFVTDSDDNKFLGRAAPNVLHNYSISRYSISNAPYYFTSYKNGNLTGRIEGYTSLERSVYIPQMEMTVTNTADSGPGSLRHAIDTVMDGGTIKFDLSLSNRTINLSGTELLIDKSITIDASELYDYELSVPGFTINAVKKSQVMQIENCKVQLVGLNITGGYSYDFGGAITNIGSELTITDCSISGNKAAISGGGIYSKSTYENVATLTISNSRVQNNYAEYHGGGIYTDTGHVTITDTEIIDNTVRGSGGGIYISGDFSAENCIIANNRAESGGGLYIIDTENDTATKLLSNCDIIANESTYTHGAGIFYYGDSLYSNVTPLVISDCIIIYNISNDNGGGVYFYTPNNRYASLEILGSEITGNSSENFGGGICISSSGLQSNTTITESIIKENTASHGGGVSNNRPDSQGNSVLTIANSQVVENNVTESGGGIYNAVKSRVVINDSKISNNTAEKNGGGFYFTDVAFESQRSEITNCIVSENKAASGAGAYVSFNNEITLSGSSFIKNSASISGGGIYNASQLIFSGVTVDNNTAVSGAGLYNTGTLTVSSSLINNNTASEYGGGLYNAGTFTITSSAISNNTASQSGGGLFNSEPTHPSMVASITLSTINGNNALNGGGIYNNGMLGVTGCKLYGNTAVENGGGFFNNVKDKFDQFFISKLFTSNSLVNGNSAANGGGGYSEAAREDSSVVFFNSTICGNYASASGGGLHNKSFIMMYNTITALNTSPSAADTYTTNDTSSKTLLENSFIGNAETGGGKAVQGNISSIIGGEAEFIKIPNNIDATNTGKNYVASNWDLRVKTGSPVIDKGNNQFAIGTNLQPLAYDIEGNPRIINKIVDIGAYETYMEYGSTIETATPLVVNENNTVRLTSNIGNGQYGKKDVDIFNFNVTQADIDAKFVFTFKTSLPTEGTAVDTYLKLFDSDGKVIAFNDDISSGNRYSEIVWTPTAADVGKAIYVGVSSYGNRNYNPNIENSGPGGATGDYQFDMTKKAPESEPGDQISKAEKITFTEETPYTKIDKIGNGLYGKTDVDLFEFEVSATDIASHNTFTFTTDAVEGGVSFDSYLKLFDANGKLIVYNDDISVSNRYSKIEWTPTLSDVGKKYFVGVSSYGNRNYNSTTENSGPGGAIGDYMLTVNNSAVGAEPGDTIKSAWEIDFDANDTFTIQDRIGNGAFGRQDIDLFRFDVTAADIGRMYTFTTSRPSEEVALFDTYLRLFDANGNELVSNDDFGGTRYSQIEWEAATAGTYYVGVSSYGNRRYTPGTTASGPGGSTGEYELAVLRGEILDSLFA